MVILGIDPGTATTGYGVVRIGSGDSFEALGWGCIRTAVELKREERLKEIHEGIRELIRLYQPDVMAIEQLFFNKNTKTALRVGEALGVTLLAAAQSALPLFEYTPLQVKETLAGYGRADKKEVRMMVMHHLSLEKTPRPDDAADGLAIALCHHFMAGLREMLR